MDRTVAPEYSIIDKINIPNVEKKELSNGIEVYVIEAQNYEISQINFVFLTGVFDQDHILQANATVKMMSKGTKKHSADEIAEIFDLLGANFSHSATMHSSFFKLTALNKHFDKLIPLITEILDIPVFDTKEFEIYKKIKKQKLTIDFQEVDYIAREELDKMIFGEKHPYGWSAIPADYDKLQIKMLIDYHKKILQKQNLKIFITSSISEKIIQLLENHLVKVNFGDLQIANRQYKIEPSNEKFKLVEKKDALQSAVRVGWRIFDRKHNDAIDFLVLNDLLGGYYGARLMQNIRQKKGYTYSIYSSAKALKYSGSFEIISEVNKENKFKVVDEIKNEIEKIRTEIVSDEDIDNMRNYVSGSLLRGMDGAFAYAGAFAGLVVYGPDLNFYNIFFQRLKNISKERIRDLAIK